ncbi:MAG TPA: cytochrome c [Pseudolabrys sp.]|nr:cytochrome c [Pseudolabrys sp.]
MRLSSIERAFALGAAALLMAAFVEPAVAGDVAKGRKIAAMKCQMCHGLDGQAKLPEAPNLAGQTEQYILTQLHAFHDKTRQNDMMSLVAPTLSEDDIADLAAYYSAIEVKIVKVPGE